MALLVNRIVSLGPIVRCPANSGCVDLVEDRECLRPWHAIAVVRPDEVDVSLDGYPFPPGSEDDRRRASRPEILKLPAPSPLDNEANNRVARHGMVNEASVDDGRVGGAIGAIRNGDGEARLAGAEIASLIEQRCARRNVLHAGMLPDSAQLATSQACPRCAVPGAATPASTSTAAAARPGHGCAPQSAIGRP